MQIKRVIIASVGLFVALAGLASAKSVDPRRPDVWRVTNTPIYSNAQSKISTEAVVVDYDGDILPGRNFAQDLGESTHSWNNVYTGGIVASSGIVNIHEEFVALSSGSFNAAGVGGFVASTGTLIAGGSTFIDVNIVQATGAPRNIVIVSSTAQIGASTTTLSGSCTFYGLDGKGNLVSEVIRFSTNMIPISSTVTVTNTGDITKWLGVGNVAFAYISSFTIHIDSMTDAFGLSTEFVRFQIGYGQKIGLANDIQSVSDVYMVTQGGTNVTNATNNPALTINTDLDTIIFPVLPNNVINYGLRYVVKKSP